MPELNPHQFNFSGESPDQLALPGMEHLSHPWAQHLAHGIRLHPAHDPEHHENLLYAYGHNPRARNYTHPDPNQSADWQHIHGVMQWADQRSTSHVPGEITWIENTGKFNLPDEEHHKVRGIAGAMMRSAHHFDFGQDTVPLHSPSRTREGNRFANRVMPELKPVGTVPDSASAPNRYKGKAQYAGRPKHPYEIQEEGESQERVKKLRPPRRVQKERLPLS